MKLRNKIITGVLLAMASTVSLAECKWKTVIDTQKWYGQSQMALARKIYLQQVVEGRYLIFDSYKIVVDGYGQDLSNVYKGMPLSNLVRFIGKTKDNQHILFTRYDGFPIKKDLYVPIRDVYEEVYKGCSTAYLNEHGVFLK
ncbi:hypothetical protein VPHG_00116 [Vibrio phage 11895-B1]|uniref:hypothetical protein n=1 Tax=Vibrio phage 11895-B1 TaxID=754075 RepID=UPI0002C0D27F|nr:hypothetical protein VPHG_00116 [Vibrio phage 11895-B1]AGH32183.1 hypothetical protein VPHG_00116 [Vibrio phage 11895-B1]